jgi:hypothetical protein
MKNFLLVFRNNVEELPKGSPEEMQAVLKKWIDWIGSIAAQNKLTDRGNRLEFGGKVLKPNNVITDGPYTEVKELISGYTIIKSNTLDEAVEIASGCPIFADGGSVEVRPLNEM